MDFDNDNNKIINIPDLYLKEKFEGYNIPKFIHFELTDRNKIKIDTFVYQILHYGPITLFKIIVGNKVPNLKYFLEFVIFEYTSKKISKWHDNIEFLNIIFDPPEYLHSNSLENKLYSYSISNNYFNNIENLIKEENDFKNKLLNYKQFNGNFIKFWIIM